MAKKTEKKNVPKTITVNLQEAITVAKEDLKTTCNVNEKILEDIKTQYGGLTIAGINDLATYEVVKDAIKNLRSLRTGIDKHRKELTSPALEYRDNLKAFADGLIDEIKPIEENLKTQQKDFEDAVEAEKKRIFNERQQLLTQNGYELTNGFFICGILSIESEQLQQMDDQQFNVYLEKGKDELKRQQAEKQRKKEEEEARERARKQLQEENERLKKQLEELNAQNNALEQTYKQKKEQEEPVEEPQKNESGTNTHKTKKTTAETAKKVFNDNGGTMYSAEFCDGFDFCKKKIIFYLQNNSGLKKSQIIDHIKNLKA